MATEQSLVDFIKDTIQKHPISGTSLIVSVFGDAIAPRGGVIWLGSLIRILEDLGFTERFVRTSVYRLHQEGFLAVEKIGRRSYYRLTERSQRQFRQAEERIYMAEQPAWNGRWDILLLSQVQKDKKNQLKRELEWLGFGNLAPNVMGHPTSSLVQVQSLLYELEVVEQTVYFQADSPLPATATSLRELVSECWALPEKAQWYREFLDHFRPLLGLLKELNSALPPMLAFQLRVLLIHFYRRILLKDPLLPETLLPSDWEGLAARRLTQNIYLQCNALAERYVSDVSETAEGPLQPITSGYGVARFDGLVGRG